MKDRATILPYPASAEQAAAKWVIRVHSKDCTDEERVHLERWLEASPQNRAAFDEFRRVWAIPRHLAGHAEVFAELAAQADVADRQRRGGAWRLALAAGFAGLAIAVAWMHGHSDQNMRMATTSHTPQSIELPDGSTVILGGKTAVEASYTSAERRVMMKGGEAFFDVAKEARRPFIVRAGNSEIRVLGTQFNVRQGGGEVEVVVREGKVNVVPVLTIATAELPRVELTPGSRLRVSLENNHVSVAQVDAELLTAWRTGMIKFDAVPMEEVVEALNRHTDRPLVIANDSIRGLSISGRFRVGDTEGFQFLLRERFGVNVEAERDRILLR